MLLIIIIYILLFFSPKRSFSSPLLGNDVGETTLDKRGELTTNFIPAMLDTLEVGNVYYNVDKIK